MSKKIKFTINGLDQDACDKFVVIKLADPKKSNTLLFRIVRPDLPQVKLVMVKTNRVSSSTEAYASFINANVSDSFIGPMLGIVHGGADAEADHHELYEVGTGAGVWANLFDINSIDAMVPGGNGGPLSECKFRVYIQILTNSGMIWKRSDIIDGSTLESDDEIYVTEPWAPPYME